MHNHLNKWKLGCFVLVFLAFALSIAITLTYSLPLGWDIHWHIKIAQVWANGQNGMFSEIVMRTNHCPYPPIFHLLFVPSVWLQNPILFARILQVFLYPLGLATSMYAISKHQSHEQAWLCGILLLSSLAFFDRLIQPIPQALDLIFFPLTIHFYLEKKPLLFISLASIMVYTHGLASFSMLGGIFLFALTQKHWKETFTFGIITSPISYFSITYLLPAIGYWGSTSDTKQEQIFWNNPLFFVFWYFGLLTIFIPLIFYYMKKWHGQDDLTKISLLTVVSLLPMFLLWQDRFFTYLSVPLSFIASYGLKNGLKNNHYKNIIYLYLFIVSMFNYLEHWYALSVGAYYIREQ